MLRISCFLGVSLLFLAACTTPTRPDGAFEQALMSASIPETGHRIAVSADGPNVFVPSGWQISKTREVAESRPPRVFSMSADVLSLSSTDGRCRIYYPEKAGPEKPATNEEKAAGLQQLVWTVSSRLARDEPLLNSLSLNDRPAAYATWQNPQRQIYVVTARDARLMQINCYLDRSGAALVDIVRIIRTAAWD